MFDFSKLGDMTKIASQAKQMHEKQAILEREQVEVLKKISSQLNEVINLLKKASLP
ncbi:MAG: hypothetical protein JSV34_03155 [Candidatus Omnitrophota bacterium]|nr:MAG: hypothetical protein JSV34_03155 [Candidatus Omnitrophota bacterium]